MNKYLKLYDLIGFKICWVLCAFCSIWNQPYLGPLATTFFIMIHLYFVRFKSRDIKIILIAILCGLLLDTSFSKLGLISYQGGIFAHYGLSPLWILSMWAGFSLSMMYTLESIKDKYIISSFLGLIGGPLSYSAGVGIGSITIHTTFAYVVLGFAWAIVVPVLFKYSNTYEI